MIPLHVLHQFKEKNQLSLKRIFAYKKQTSENLQILSFENWI